MICQHYCLLSTNQCYYSHSQEIFSSSYRCCSCSIPIEEIFTWIIICSLTFLLYNTIKLCIIIFGILFIIYWIYKQTELRRLFNEFYQQRFNSKSLTDEQKFTDSLIEDNHVINKSINPDEDTQELNENDNDSNSFSTKTLSNSNLDINTTSNNDFSKANHCDDNIIKTTKKSKINLNKKQASTTKKLLIENTQDQEANNSISQPGYYGPIHTIINNPIQCEESSSTISEALSTNKPIEHDKRSIDDIIEQTKDIRQMLEALHEDILQLKTNSNKETIDNLSPEEQSILKLAAKNLIQVIISTRIVNKSSEERIRFLELLNNDQIVMHNEKQESSNDNNRLAKEMNYQHTDIISKYSEVASNEIISSQFQHPKCITVQTSFAINSSMPRVPTKTTVIAINDEEDEKSYDDYIKTSQHIITTNEQFENILSKDERKLENALFLKQDSTQYNNEQPDWAYYSSKPDLFPHIDQSNLPIIQSERQHSSFKQTFLSHFHHHHHPKFPSTNNPSTLHSSSINASNNLSSVSSHSNEFNLQNNINANDQIESYESDLPTGQKFLHHKALNHLTQRIFRVRKSRIIISFDDIQQQKDAGDNDENNLNSLMDTVVHDMSTEINYVCSCNEQQTKVRNSSIVSLFQSFDSAIKEGELLIYNDTSFYQDNSENEDSLSDISNSLYSVTSQLILI